MKRWKHLRDAFAKAEKRANESKARGSRGTKKRKYIFYDELQFLKKLYGKTVTTGSFLVEDVNEGETDGSGQQPFEHSQHEAESTTETKTVCNIVPQKKHKKIDEVNLKVLEKTNEVNLIELNTNEVNLKSLEKITPEKLNAQMSFYHSLLSHTEKFNSDEWLQFQIEVLQIISNIKNQKAAVPYTYIAQSNEFQQQCQPAVYHLQPHCFSQPFQQPFMTQTALPSQPKQNLSTSTTRNSLPSRQDPSSSIPMRDKITAVEYYGRCNKHVGEEDGEISSVDSYDSSSTTEMNF